MVISFFVSGIPKPAGSKRAVIKNGKAIVFDMSKNKQWRKDVSTVAKIAMKNFGINEPLNCPIAMGLRFVIKKPNTSKHKYPIVRPDLTKLIRCVEDAMNNIVYKDDALIIEQQCSKYYDNYSGVYVTIKTLN